MKKKSAMFALLAVLGTNSAMAQDTGDKISAEEAARELANPNSPLASLTLKVQYTTFKGDLPNADDQDKFGLTFSRFYRFRWPTATRLSFARRCR